MADQVWTYFGDSTNMLEDQIRDAILRGVVVKSISIGYGPSPRKAGGYRGAGDCWHAILIVNAEGATN